jgi:hypothetical protein
MLEITVHDIKGHCPVYKVGDKIVIQFSLALQKKMIKLMHTFNVPIPDSLTLRAELSCGHRRAQVFLSAPGRGACCSCMDFCGNSRLVCDKLFPNRSQDECTRDVPIAHATGSRGAYQPLANSNSLSPLVPDPI